MREDERMEIKQLYEAGASISVLTRRFGHDGKIIRSALIHRWRRSRAQERRVESEREVPSWSPTWTT